MASEESQQRLAVLENQVKELDSALRQTAIDAAFVYIRSNWSLIRWRLVREQDQNGEGSEIFSRAKNAEGIIDHHLARNLREVCLEPQPMDAAYRWCIETTATLQKNGYTFFDSA